MGSRIDSSAELETLNLRVQTAYREACDARDNYEFRFAYRAWWDAKKELHALEVKVGRRDRDRERKRELQATDPEYRERRKAACKKYRQTHTMTEREKEMRRESNRRYRAANLEKVMERDRIYEQKKRERLRAEKKDAQRSNGCS